MKLIRILDFFSWLLLWFAQATAKVALELKKSFILDSQFFILAT